MAAAEENECWRVNGPSRCSFMHVTTSEPLLFVKAFMHLATYFKNDVVVVVA